MHRRALLVLALMSLGAVPALAQRDQEMIHALSVKQLRELMSSMDLDPQSLRASDSEGLFFQVNDLPAVIYIKDAGKTLEIIGLLQDVDPGEERINEFNAEKRFARAFVTDDDLFLQQDIDLQLGITRANVRSQIELFKLLAGNFVEAFK